MGKKIVILMTLIITICFLVLGIICKSGAERQKGVTTTVGIMLDGEFVPQSSGNLAANPEKYETLNTMGTSFFVLSGISGIICIVSFIYGKRNN